MIMQLTLQFKESQINFRKLRIKDEVGIVVCFYSVIYEEKLF